MCPVHHSDKEQDGCLRPPKTVLASEKKRTIQTWRTAEGTESHPEVM